MYQLISFYIIHRDTESMTIVEESPFGGWEVDELPLSVFGLKSTDSDEYITDMLSPDFTFI